MSYRLIKEYNIEDSTLAQFGTAGPRIQTIQLADSSFNILDDSAANTGSVSYIVITGSGFNSSSLIIVGDTLANFTTYVSPTVLRGEVPAKTAGAYTVYVQNDDGATAIRVNGLIYSPFPTWDFGSLILRDKIVNYPFVENFNVSSESNTLIYSVATGSTLPANTTLLANGYFYGIPTSTGSNAFYLDVSDGESQNTSQPIIMDVGNGDPEYYRTPVHLVAREDPSFIKDASANNHTFKVNGDTKTTSFHPFGENWCYSFDGTGDYLTYADNDFLNFLNLDFTMECWFLTPVTPGAVNVLSKRATSTTIAGARLGFASTLFPVFEATLNGTTYGVSITSSVAITLGKWNHIACTRAGDTWTIWVNGVSGGSTTASGTIPRNTAAFVIGGTGNGTGLVGVCFISDVRLIFTRAEYLSAFTPPTSKLTRTVDTVLLTLQDRYLVDRSNNNFSVVTQSGDVAARPVSPYGDNSEYDSVRAGSVYFDATGDNIQAFDRSSNHPDFNFPGDFTWECYFYHTGTFATTHTLYDVGVSLTADPRMQVYFGVNRNIVLRTFGNTDFYVGPTNSLYKNVWHHLLIVRSGTTLTVYLDGKRSGASVTNSTSFETRPGRPVIGGGGNPFGGNAFLGYMSNLRILKNTVLWTSNTAPPSAPLANIANTVLLTLQTYDGENNRRVVDKSKAASLVSYLSGINAAQGSFTPFSPKGYGVYFDGSLTTPDYISVPANTNLTLGANDHCIEFWMYPRGDQLSFATLWSYSGIGSPGNGPEKYYFRTNLASMVLRVANTNVAFASGQYADSLNKWSHIAITRTGDTFRLFRNGVLRGHANVSTTITAQVSPLYIGGDTQVVNQPWNGYVSNFRVTINSVPELYQTSETTTNTSIFTPPTSDLTLEPNTQLLLCATNRFIDLSNNNFTVTKTGDARIIPFSGHKGSAVYQPHLHAASMYFDGTGDYLTATYFKQLHDWHHTTGQIDYTIECWIYPVALPATTTVPHVIGCQAATTTTSYWAFGIRNTGAVVFSYNNGAQQYVVSTQTVKAGEWSHIAMTYTSSGIRVWVNGVANPAVAISGTPQSTLATTGFTVNSYNNGSTHCYLSNLRIVKGEAIYTANSAPPTAPVTKTANTVFMLDFDTGAIIDYTTNHNFDALGDTRVVPAPTRAGSIVNNYRNRYTNTAIHFDGTGDYLTVPVARSFTESFNTGDWCIEFWIYRNVSGVQHTIYDQRSATTQQSPFIYLSTTNNIIYYLNGAARITTEAISSNTWVHVAVERYSNNVTIYLNGSRSGVSWLDSNIHYINAQSVGAATGVGTPYNGYLQDFRITIGSRYGANLTSEYTQSYPIG